MEKNMPTKFGLIKASHRPTVLKLEFATSKRLSCCLVPWLLPLKKVKVCYFCLISFFFFFAGKFLPDLCTYNRMRCRNSGHRDSCFLQDWWIANLNKRPICESSSRPKRKTIWAAWIRGPYMSCLVGPKTTSKSGDKTAHKAHKGPNISRCHARTHALRVKRGERQVEADPASRRRRRRRRDQAAAGAAPRRRIPCPTPARARASSRRRARRPAPRRCCSRRRRRPVRTTPSDTTTRARLRAAAAAAAAAARRWRRDAVWGKRADLHEQRHVVINQRLKWTFTVDFFFLTTKRER